MFSTIYGLNLSGFDGELKAIEGGPSMGYGSAALGAGYADVFRKDRSPTQGELLSHLVGVAFRCAKLNSDGVALNRLRLYIRTEKGQPKAKFAQAAEAGGRRVTTKRGINHRLHVLRSRAVTKSALLDAVESDDDNIEEVLSHPIIDVLRAPEDAFIDAGLPGYQHRFATMMQLESIGRSYWFINKWSKILGGGNPIPNRMMLLRSQIVVEKPDLSGERYISKYEYGTNNLDPEDVIRFTYPDPSNPHMGYLSPMRAAVEKVRQARGGDAFIEALLKNGGFPLGVISPADSESIIGDAEAARLQSDIRRSSSESNVGRMMILKTANVKLQTLAWKPAEVIDINRAIELQGEICDCFDVPRTKIFRNTSNLASSESGDEAHAKDAILPRCCLLEEAMNAQLVPLFDPSGRLFLAYDSPVPADKEFEADLSKSGVATGAASLDEYRAGIGLDPLEGEIGECHLIPSGVTLVKPDGTVVETAAPEPTPAPGQTQPAAPRKAASKRHRREMRQVKRLLKAFIEQASKPADKPVPSANGNRMNRLLAEGYTEAEVTALSAKHVCPAGEL